ncbi:hypothetical protein [Lacinutrix venerupis]|uniref:Uncharacterized protein n=1 Tax=Lacinutrix venerupis TaxID=1486034 RepID=A0AAC9PVU7_9FLAO|nr:hypothetical protein [Lacinutrix venerupis]APY00052.1 hypothetical protein BWR22_06925 [Lacinutrix venerupis]
MRNRNLILLFYFIFCGFTFSQEKKVDDFLKLTDDLSINGKVKEISITSHRINKEKDTITRTTDYNFSKEGKVNRINYPKTNLIKLIDYDNLSRIKKISFIKNDSTNIFLVQFFSNKTNYPDSILINKNSNYIEKYVNTFKNNLVIKREKFINNKLISHRNYEFDTNNQLIKETYTNPKNKSGKIFSYEETNDGITASYYPVSNITYKYQLVNDTIIKTTLKQDLDRKEVSKTLIRKDSKIEIKNIFDSNKLKESRIIHSLKDSISNIHLRFNENNEVKRYYNKFTNPSSITTKWTMYKNDNESSFTIDIKTIYDQWNNWIKKIYSRDNIITEIKERKIIYRK